MKRITLALIIIIFTVLLYSTPTVVEYRAKQLSEVSGIDVLSNCDSLFFAINDSGNPNEIIVLDYEGNIKQYVAFPRHLKNKDWEDMTATSLPNNRGILFIGDIGNNKFFKNSYQVYLAFITLPETKYNYVRLDSIKTVNFTMGKNRYDAETLFYDAKDDNLYIVTKWGNYSKIFELSGVMNIGEEVVSAKLVGTSPMSIVTAGDLSDDGKHLLIKTYIDIFYWKRKPGESIGSMCSRTPDSILPYESEPQGESIMWSSDQKYYYTISEHNNRKTTYLYKYDF